MNFPRRHLLLLASALSALLSVFRTAGAESAEIKILCNAAITTVTDELFARFERATGHKLTVRYEFGPILNREIERGEVFDVAILSLDVEELVKRGKIADGTRVVLGRTGIGVGTGKGLPKPDVSTTEAFKRALLNAKSVAYSKEGSSGLYFLGLLERLGISEEMKTKLRPQPPAVPTAQAVATGEAEIVVVGAALILLEPGAELVGLLPVELQNYVTFTAGLSAAAKEPEAGKALLDFLGSPETLAMLKTHGVEPFSP
jgi:molybdate transport system substrate-binding protein